MRPMQRDEAGHEAEAVHHRGEEQRVERGHEAGTEQERPVVHRNQRAARRHERRGVAADDVVAEGHDREQADRTDDEDRGLEVRVARNPIARVWLYAA